MRGGGIYYRFFDPTQPATSPTKEQQETVRQTYGKLPLIFIENQGQLAPQVAYYTQGPAGTLYFTKEGMTIEIIKRETIQKVSFPPQEQIPTKGKRLVLRQGFVGANPNPRIEARVVQQGRINIFRGNDPSRWQSGIPAYGEVVYKDLYPGIDLVYSGKTGRLKYEFIVRPGADYRKIQVAYAGAKGLSLNDAGDIIIKTALGELYDTRPVSYQEIDGRKVEVESRFRVIDSGTHGFWAEEYDARYSMIIDPDLVYSTYLGGSNFEEGVRLVTDATGNAYITGITSSTDFPASTGTFDRTFNGELDVFVAKFSANGTLAYATYIGGTQGEFVFGIAVDVVGNVYIRGQTSSPDLPTTLGAFDTSFNGGFSDAFVAKLDATGANLLYSTYLGGSGNETSGAVATDSLGNAYVAGGTSSPDFPTTAGAFDRSYHAMVKALVFDAFATKIDPTGSVLIYSTYIGGNQNDFGGEIAIDEAGNAYLPITTSSSDLPTTPGAFDRSRNAGFDVYVAKLDPSGSALSYATYLGGDGDDVVGGTALDLSGNVYLTGNTTFNFPVTVGAFDTSFNGGAQDAFVAKIDTTGSTLLYSTYLGGNAVDSGNDIEIDLSGNAFITGTTRSVNFPVTTTSFRGGFDDAYVTELNADGSALLFGTYLGGSDSDGGTGIAVDVTGNIYVVGTTSSTNFPTLRAFDASFNGVADAFVAKFGTAPANQAPDVSRARPTQAILWPPNHRFVPILIVGVTDPDGDPVTITITQIRQDEPTNSLGDGGTSPDAAGLGTAFAVLRAERLGKGNGRVYTINFEARDDKGGVSGGSVTVGVPHDQGKGQVPVNDGVFFDSTQ